MPLWQHYASNPAWQIYASKVGAATKPQLSYLQSCAKYVQSAIAHLFPLTVLHSGNYDIPVYSPGNLDLIEQSEMKQYLDLVKTVLETGTIQENRTGSRRMLIQLDSIAKYPAGTGFSIRTRKSRMTRRRNGNG